MTTIVCESWQIDDETAKLNANGWYVDSHRVIDDTNRVALHAIYVGSRIKEIHQL